MNRLIPGGRWMVRQLCTAAEVEAGAEVVAVSQDKLYRRLSFLEATGGTVSQTLNQYVMEGKVINKYELVRCVKELRKYRDYKHALEIMEWMEMRKINFSKTDYTMRIDLIAKAKGISAAEDYFNGLNPSAKNLFTYGALLNCYCKECMEDKALDLFQKMDELKYVTNLAFNNLMSLYMRKGQPEKVPPLVEDMKQRNIPMSTFTYIVLMNSHSSLNDIEGVERVFEEMKKEDQTRNNWNTFSNLAAIYVKAGNFEKAEFALKKVEEVMNFHDREAYHFLISLYANCYNLDEVKRVWCSLKSALHATNMSYLVMLQALRKLKDVEGLTECFKEWESSCSFYDMRLASVAISAYLNQGLLKDAELVFENAIKRAKAGLTLFKSREMFMMHFLKLRKVDLALGHLKATLSEVKDHAWRPSPETITAFMEFYEEAKDVDGAEDLCGILKSLNCIDSNFYHLLLKTYIAAGKSASEMRQRLDEDDIEISCELKKLLGSVC